MISQRRIKVLLLQEGWVDGWWVSKSIRQKLKIGELTCLNMFTFGIWLNYVRMLIACFGVLDLS